MERSWCRDGLGADMLASFGAWLLLLVALLPHLLELVPVASLAAVLVVVGLKLVDRSALAELRRLERGELLVYATTAAGVVATDLLKGVVAGLAVAAAVLLHRLTRLRIDVETTPTAS